MQEDRPKLKGATFQLVVFQCIMFTEFKVKIKSLATVNSAHIRMYKKMPRCAVTLEMLYFFTRYLITFMLHNSTITLNQNYMSDCVLAKSSNSPKHIQIMNNYLVGYNKLTICTSFHIISPKSPGNNGLCGDLNTSVFHSEN